MSLLSLLSGAFAPKPTEVSPVDVQAPPRQALPQSPGTIMPPAQDLGPLSQPPQMSPADGMSSGGLNYDNSGAISAIHKVLGANQPQGGSTNPGVYGLLPQGLQHGTFRNVLGALGDAFLVGSNRDRQYAPRMERQAIGDAMAGLDPTDPASMQAAIQRVAATGSPGAAEMADKMQTSYDNYMARQAQMKYMAEYHQQGIDNRNQNVYARQGPMAQGMVAGASDSADYAKRYAILDKRAKAVDPNSDASSAYGIPTPDEWEPGMANYGMTSNNQQVSADKAAGRDVSVRNNQNTNRTRIQAAGISAGKPTGATILDDLRAKQDRGEQLTPAEQAIWNKDTNIPKGKGKRALIGLPGSGGTPTGGAAASQPGPGNGQLPAGMNASQLPQLTWAQAQQLKINHPGKHMYFRGPDGKPYHN